jgi:hypothetical protein
VCPEVRIDLNLEKIKNFISDDKFLITNHARIRMFERNISTDILKLIVMHGEIIEKYPDDTPYPSALIIGYWNEQPWHLVIAQTEDHARIITVYKPDKEKWIEYRKRKG